MMCSVPIYKQMKVTYSDLAGPKYLYEDPELFYGFWGTCYNNYTDTAPHKASLDPEFVMKLLRAIRSYCTSQRGLRLLRVSAGRLLMIGISFGRGMKPTLYSTHLVVTLIPISTNVGFLRRKFTHSTEFITSGIVCRSHAKRRGPNVMCFHRDSGDTTLRHC